MAKLDAARSGELTPSEPGTSLPLVPGLLPFALLSLLGNELASWLRYPELGSAVLFVPYAVLTAVPGLLPAEAMGMVSPPRGG